jgi:hypothetical protein
VTPPPPIKGLRLISGALMRLMIPIADQTGSRKDTAAALGCRFTLRAIFPSTAKAVLENFKNRRFRNYLDS